MTLEWIAEELGDHANVEVVLLLLGCLASGFAARLPTHRALARFGLAVPLVVLVMTLVRIEISHVRLLEIFDFVPTDSPVPRDQRSTAAATELSFAPLFIGCLVAVILPIATWVWARVELPGRYGLAWLLVAGSSVLSFTLWTASYWADAHIFELGVVCRLISCSPHGWMDAQASFESLDGLRDICMMAGALFGVTAIVYAVRAARRGVAAGSRQWATALALLGLGIAAKAWTAAERQDTVDYFRWLPRGHNGFDWLHGDVPDPFAGPRLEHCSFEWHSNELIRVFADTDHWSFTSSDYRDSCGDPDGITALLVESEAPMSQVVLALKDAEATQTHRLGLASLRPRPVSRSTTGEFVQLRSCVVEFRLEPAADPIERFSSFAEFAEAVDAAAGELVVSLAPDEPGARTSP